MRYIGKSDCVELFEEGKTYLLYKSGIFHIIEMIDGEEYIQHMYYSRPHKGLIHVDNTYDIKNIIYGFYIFEMADLEVKKHLLMEII